jgi:hypothetical protein
MIADPAFERQFQWEVDRWVFRHKHRGEPIQVSIEERDRLLALHRSRLAIWNCAVMAFCLAMFCLIAIWFDWRLALVAMPLAYYVGTATTMPVFLHWAYTDVAKQLRGRQIVGLPLGRTGRLARKAEPLSMRQLVFSSVLGVVGVAFGLWATARTGSGGHPVLAALFGGSAVVIVLLTVWMTILKWAQLERDRVRQESFKALQRARDLRAD